MAEVYSIMLGRSEAAHLGLVPIWCLIACTAPGNGDTPGDSAIGVHALSAPERLALAYSVVGDPAPGAELLVEEVGGVAGGARLAPTVTGPFELLGDLSALQANEQRLLQVTFTGATDAPGTHTGTLTLVSGEARTETLLGAVVAAPDLPQWPGWTEEAFGRSVIVPLPSAPFPYVSGSWTDPSVMIAAPPTLRDDGQIGLVVHLHGHNAVLADVVAAQFLREQLAYSGRNALMIIPQGPVNAASGDFGKLMQPDGLAHLVRDVLTLLFREQELIIPGWSTLTLTAHSGGYAAAAEIIIEGGVPASQVHLFDALYAQETTFRDFVVGGGTLRSSYTSSGGTGDTNVILEGMLQSGGHTVVTTFDDQSLFTAGVIIGPSSYDHADCIVARRNFGRWLRGAPVLPAPGAPVELLSVTPSGAGEEARVAWRDRPLSGAIQYVVRGSDDGVAWTVLAATQGTEATVPRRAYVDVAAVGARGPLDTPGSDRYGCTGDEWLVVDGFDRIYVSSYGALTHDFPARLGHALPSSGGFATASNEAVAAGEVELGDYARVLWLLGDESNYDRTFDADEQSKVEAFVAAGGELVVSGSDVGYATDGGWLSSVLHATYISDDAGTNRAGGYEFGVTYPEEYPDVLSGTDVIWSYETGGAAAVGYAGQIVVVGFPLETLAPASYTAALAELMAYLDSQ